MDSVTGRHVALKCLQDSDPKTSSALLPLPHPCPPTGAKETHLMDSMKRCSDSLPREGGPTPPKKGHLSTDSLHREIKTAPSTNPERTKGQRNKVVWNFINEDDLDLIKNNFNKPLLNHVRKYNEEVLDFTENNYSNKPLRDRKDLKDKFLQMLKNQPKSLMENKYNQQAFAILKKTNNEVNNEQCDLFTEEKEEESMNNEIELIGPFVPKGKKHSEDLLIKQLKKRNNFSEAWIYTTNSPCLGRKSHSPSFIYPVCII
ncbi:uncharacterized protein LOC132859927 [Tachysurus vachellii]|uniref:uncharacterized protein LOC132859927 n=1 Tax=Tachysurus vachellii TaxID=175792 RepID=UPI00296A9FD4|nr:uncharacterized protein LOC132859927 [Tachysurus vachellii]